MDDHLPEAGCCERHDKLRNYARYVTFVLFAMGLVVLYMKFVVQG